MSRHVMMMGKCTRWATSGRKNIWVPSAPAPAMGDSRCVMDYVKKVKVQILCMYTFFVYVYARVQLCILIKTACIPCDRGVCLCTLTSPSSPLGLAL